MSDGPVIFDLFHTLVDPDDFRPSGFRRLEAAAAVLGVEFGVLESAWNDALPMLLTGRETVRGLLRRVAHQNGLPARTIEIAPAAEPLGRYQDLALLHPRSDVVALLDALKPRPTALLTNCHDRDVEAWSRSPLATRIDHAVFSTKIGAAKPAAAAYQAALDALGVGPEAVTYVGNGGDRELEGAAAIGMGYVVHFAAFDDARGRTSAAEREVRSSFATRTVGTVAELQGLLAR